MIKLKQYFLLTLLFVVTSLSYAQDDVACPCKGWKGLVELSAGKGLGFEGTGRVMLSGVGGYQFNPVWFAGAGFGYDFHNKLKFLFADLRATANKKVAPYADIKAGANLDDSHFYISPSLGCRYGLDNGHALYFGLGLDFTKTTHYDAVPNVHLNNSVNVNTSDVSSVADNYALCLKASYEF